MFRSIFFRRIFLPFLAMIVLATAGLGFFAAMRLRTTYLDSRKLSLHSELQLAASILGPDLSTGRGPLLQREVKSIGEKTGCRVTVIDADGVVLADSWADASKMENHLHRPEVQDALRRGEGSSERTSATVHQGMLYMARQFTAPDHGAYFLRLAVRLSDLTHELRVLYLGVGSLAVLLAAAAVLLAYVSTKRQAEAVMELTALAADIAEGDFDHRASHAATGEIGTLGVALNKMADSLQALIAQTEKDRDELLTILASMAEGVIATESEQHIVVANNAAAGLLGFDLASATGKPLWQVVRMDRVIKAAQEAMESGLRSSFELGMVNGRHLEVTLSPIRPQSGDAGEVRGLVLVVHDTTQSVRYQELRKEFVANVSHELRTPLTVIKGYVETLRDGAINDAGRAEQYLATIERHTNQLTNLVNDLLELSRLESQPDMPQRQAVDVAQCVRRAIDLLGGAAGKKNQTLTSEIHDVPRIIGNADYLERAAANLIDNAIKYTGEGGRIAVSLRSVGGYVMIEVADNGIGVPKDDLPRIFERFYRVDRSRSREMGGTGLGLSIVKHIAQVHGGSVEVMSEVGEGSTFRLKIPLPQAVVGKPIVDSKRPA